VKAAPDHAASRQLLAGLSAWRWSGIERIVLLLSGIAALGGVVLVGVRPAIPWEVPAAVAICGFLLLVSLRNMFVQPSLHRARAERAVGYTTRPDDAASDLVSYRTGTVLRPAGGEGMTRRAYRAAVKAERGSRQ
jgi:hypothetical protein